ncbi:hypothetical protein GCM10009604_04580 [Corynebacterium aurimucosum]|uniref:hypothetical protein n=1 Tax=Corynebacterium aurimucosum TaxID=169292 RepID=UPI00191D74B8|nr:hypothetical protein [Corynebacterium aurimucosum]QQU94458.1 hypothetical protein I6I66_06450 [Corynebacterium aurimucosum]UTA72646.1 hypothetical protein J3S22_06245 [Corynebacterium aurimucosum]WJY70982.1 hypothetical protein CAURIM_09415 [Corynebacterium aurimucosum]
MGDSDLTIPVWGRDAGTYASQRWFSNLVRRLGIAETVSVGMDALLFAAKINSGLNLVSVLVPGDLDISSRRPALIRRFVESTRQTSALVLFDEWEMSKAASLGSEAPHFLWAINTSVSNRPDEGSPIDKRRVAVVYEHSLYAEAPSLTELGLEDLDHSLTGVELDIVSSNSAYWYADADIDRKFRSTYALRFGKYTELVFPNCGPDTIALAQVASEMGTKVYAVESIATVLLSRRCSLVEVVGQSRVKDRLVENSNGFQNPAVDSEVWTGRSFNEILSLVGLSDWPWYFEDFGDSGEMNIFLSVAAIENISSGARPQRIRNMYLAASREKPTIHLSFNHNLVRRRVKLIKYLVGEDISFPVFYGENSTTPVRSRDAVLQISRLLDYLSINCGTQSAYFVRDVHWLDEQLEVSEAKNVQEIRAAGKFELETLQKSFGAMVAPSYESAQHYAALAKDYFDLRFSDAELPPAINPINAFPAGQGAVDVERTTFVYTGGVSALYSMEAYLDALAEVFRLRPEEVFADFIVRPAEQDLLESWLAKVGLSSDPRVRVLNGDFSNYVSRTKANIGILLLESAYGRKAFAFKAVSYLERALPYVVYMDSPNHRYFAEDGVTIPVLETDGIVDALLESLDVDCSIMEFESLWSRESWQERWNQVRDIARRKVREIA